MWSTFTYMCSEHSQQTPHLVLSTGWRGKEAAGVACTPGTAAATVVLTQDLRKTNMAWAAHNNVTGSP